MGELTAFQDTFLRLLAGEGDAAELGGSEAARTGLAIYRNTIAKGLRDALRATFPTVERLVGDEWFAGCAGVYAAGRPPSQPSLQVYGDDFAAFLAGFPPAADLPYLADVAQIDWLWNAAHLAPDSPVLGADIASRLAPEALFALRAPLHSAARVAWFDTPAARIWMRDRPDRASAEVEADIPWIAGGVLLTRPGDTVQARLLDAADWAFLDACRQGASLGEAASAALMATPEADLAALFADLVALGALGLPEPNPST